jgi:predicted permease
MQSIRGIDAPQSTNGSPCARLFVLLLGYVAGKQHDFDARQSEGLSKLALNFALPASLFVSMTAIPEDLLLKQGRLLLALTITPRGVIRHRLACTRPYKVAAWRCILNLCSRAFNLSNPRFWVRCA